MPDSENTEKDSFGWAFTHCRQVRFRHTRSMFVEAFIVLFILAVTLTVVYQAGSLQSERNDDSADAIVGLRMPLSDLLAENDQSIVEALESLVENGSYSDQFGPVDEKRSAEEYVEEERRTKAIVATVDAISKRADATQVQMSKLTTDAVSIESRPFFSDLLIYGTGAIFIVSLGSLLGLYRFHLRELRKNEESELLFLRLKSALDFKESPNFDPDIKRALLSNIFGPTVGEKMTEGRIESPFPGIVSGDIATEIANRVISRLSEMAGKRLPDG